MQTWRVVNNSDGNISFTVEGDNYGEAAYEALAELGWSVAIPSDEPQCICPPDCHDEACPGIPEGGEPSRAV